VSGPSADTGRREREPEVGLSSSLAVRSSVRHTVWRNTENNFARLVIEYSLEGLFTKP